jgi:hypothetical protein
MRKLVFLLFGVMSASSAMADGTLKLYDKVVLVLQDGRVFDIEINADSYIYSYTKGEDTALVQYVEVHGTREMYLFSRDELLSMKFIECGTAMSINNDILVDECNPMRYVNGELVFHNTLHGEKIDIFDPAGKLVFSDIVTPERKISLEHFVQGAYLVKVKGYKTKVVVR